DADDRERADPGGHDRAGDREDAEQEARDDEERDPRGGRPHERHARSRPARAARPLRIAHAEGLTHERARSGGETDAREERERLDLADDLVRRDVLRAEAEHETRQEEDA